MELARDFILWDVALQVVVPRCSLEKWRFVVSVITSGHVTVLRFDSRNLVVHQYIRASTASILLFQ